MRRLHIQVRTFHEKFGHPVRTKPEIPSEAEVRFRMSLIAEEFLELVDAVYGSGALEDYSTIGPMLRGLIREAEVNVNLPDAVDAMGDLDYVVEGTRIAFGIDGDPIADEIQRANMDKHPTGPTNKPTKPAEWKAPDIDACLRAQGWEPLPKKEEL